MSGSGTSSGIEFQARVIAYIYIHVLGENRLSWFPRSDDTPRAVSAETGGAGDDVQIEFASELADTEIQVKKGLSAGADLADTVLRILQMRKDLDQPVVIAVDGKCSNAIREKLPRDLLRIRTGRTESLTKTTRDLLDALRLEPGELAFLHLQTVDVHDDSDAGTQHALLLLRNILEDKKQDIAAWRILVTHGLGDSANRLRANRETLVTLLHFAGIRLRKPDPELRALDALAFAEEFRTKYRPDLALQALRRFRGKGSLALCSSDVTYKWSFQHAKCLFSLADYDEALRSVEAALDTRPAAVEALVLRARLHTRLGDLPNAFASAQAAVEADPDSGAAWGALAEVRLAGSQPQPDVPEAVAHSTDYLQSMAETSTESADWEPVLDYTSRLLKAGSRQPHVLLFRAHALLCQSYENEEPDSRKLQEAVRLASEVMTDVDDEDSAIVRGALIVRILALEHLGDKDTAEKDRDLLRRVAPQDSDAIRVFARSEFRAGNLERALRHLENPTVDYSPELLLLRAEIRTRRGDYDQARTDLFRCLEVAPPTTGRHLLSLEAAERFLDLNEADTAKTLIESIPEGVKPAHIAFLRGRMSLIEDDLDQSEAHYRQAALLDPQHTSSFLSDLGSRLLDRKETTRALRVLDDAYRAGLPDPALPMYVHALMGERRLRNAYQIVESVLSQEDPPTWALAIAVEIALLQEDEDRAIEMLTMLASRKGVTAHAGLKLCELLVELGRFDEVLIHLKILQQRDDLRSEEKMAIAHLYLRARSYDAAFDFALQAYRADPRSQRIHKGLVQLAFLHREAIPPPKMVDANTHVVLETKAGDRVEYTVYSEGACDPARDEIDVDTAKSLGVFGQSVGDQVTFYKATLKEQEYTVVELIPAIQHVVATSAHNYERWFPTDPHFFLSFTTKANDPSSILVPIMVSLEGKRRHAEQVFKFYREMRLPLGFVASALAASIPEVIEGICFDPDMPGQLIVELGDEAAVSRSGREASRIGQLVLSRSALWTASRLGVLSELAAGFRLTAPSSLRAELRTELREAERRFSEGYSIFSSTRDGQLAMPKLEPEAEELKRGLDELRELVNWCRTAVHFLPRSLESITEAGLKGAEFRDDIGRSSYDGMGLAKHSGVLYCDDQGLRELHHSEGGEASLSSLGLLSTLVERTLLVRERYFKCLAELLEWGYYAIPPRVDFLLWALGMASEFPGGLLEKAFALLSNPTMVLPASAALVGQLLRTLALAPVVGPHSVGAVTARGIRALQLRWPRVSSAQSVLRAAEVELALLPTVLRPVREVCRNAIQGSGIEHRAPDQGR